MFDIAIIGGGLCGLSIAEQLQAGGESVLLLEARDRLGGRILSMTDEENGLAVDLGASWFWPDAQPLVTALIERLGLTAFAQPDEGEVLSLTEVDKGPKEAGNFRVHGGAHRVTGGMGGLVGELAKRLGTTDVRLGHAVTQIADEGDHVRIGWAAPSGEGEALARRVAIALPPRLAAALFFLPALDPATISALDDLPTWMATSAKLVAACAAPVWRDQWMSGSAFVLHEQAVLAETWDASDGAPAIGGFLAMSPAQRADFAYGLPMLIDNQLMQLFGQALSVTAQHYRDWATETLTCAPADLVQGPIEHPLAPSPELRARLWGGKLHLAGSELAAREPGYMEGALGAAAHAVQAIGVEKERAAIFSRPANAEALAQFLGWLDGQRADTVSAYRAALSARLMRQDREQLTQICLLGAIEDMLGRAVEQLELLPFDGEGIVIEGGRSGLLPGIQAPFKPFLDAVIGEVLEFNATSCALSNFAVEAKPSREYRDAIMRDIGAAWVEFSLAANAVLLRKHPVDTVGAA